MVMVQVFQVTVQHLNNRQTMWRLNDSCTLSGMTFSGMTGQLQGSGGSDGLTRPTTGTGATATGVVCVNSPGSGLLIHLFTLLQGHFI